MTHGLALRPFFTALRASRPAASMTDGFEVFVHDVIAAIVTAPWSSVNFWPSSSDDRGRLRAPSSGAWLWWWCVWRAVLVLGRVSGRVGCRERLRALEVDQVVVDVGVVR